MSAGYSWPTLKKIIIKFNELNYKILRGPPFHYTANHLWYFFLKKDIYGVLASSLNLEKLMACSLKMFSELINLELVFSSNVSYSQGTRFDSCNTSRSILINNNMWLNLKWSCEDHVTLGS